MILKTSAGEYNMEFLFTCLPENKPVYARNRDKGNYHFVERKITLGNFSAVGLNLTHKDPVRRRLFQDKSFRIGLSHAIDRDELIKTVYQRQGTPWQVCPRPETPGYADKEMGKQYVEYDLDRANQFLDRAGLTERDSGGIRLDASGRPVRIRMIVRTDRPLQLDVLEVISKNWAEVGIDMRPDSVVETLWYTSMEANELDGSIDEMEYGQRDAVMNPRWYIPYSDSAAFWAPQWKKWYWDEPGKEKPPEPMIRAMELYRSGVREAATEEDRVEAMRQMVQIAKEEFWVIGTALPPNRYTIVRNDTKNVPDSYWHVHLFNSPSNTNPCQYFVES